MCKFFSFLSDGNGKYYYFNWQQRKELLKNNPKNYNADSHTSIADYYGFCGEKEDKLNKYEYNPLTKRFNKDKININDDSKNALDWVMKLDFKTVVKPLILKDIFNPLSVESKVTKNDIKLLKNWDSVMASVWDSVGASVVASVWDSVWASVGASVRASIMDPVMASVGDPVRDSIGYSVGDSVLASVWAYYSSFFHLKYKYDFYSLNKLWDKGLVPSFDGKTWRLHTGKNAKIVFKITKEELNKIK